jgi:hypothetical protein
MKPRQIITTVLVAWLLGAAAATAHGEGEGANRADRVLRNVGPDLIAAGSTLLISQPVAGDLFAAAGTLDVHGDVGGDALPARGGVFGGKSGVYAAGGRVAVNAPVQRTHRQRRHRDQAAGQIAATASPGRVIMHGPIDGYLRRRGPY